MSERAARPREEWRMSKKGDGGSVYGGEGRGR